jgi:hypothetical protein
MLSFSSVNPLYLTPVVLDFFVSAARLMLACELHHQCLVPAAMALTSTRPNTPSNHSSQQQQLSPPIALTRAWQRACAIRSVVALRRSVGAEVDRWVDEVVRARATLLLQLRPAYGFARAPTAHNGRGAVLQSAVKSPKARERWAYLRWSLPSLFSGALSAAHHSSSAASAPTVTILSFLTDQTPNWTLEGLRTRLHTQRCVAESRVVCLQALRALIKAYRSGSGLGVTPAADQSHIVWQVMRAALARQHVLSPAAIGHSSSSLSPTASGGASVGATSTDPITHYLHALNGVGPTLRAALCHAYFRLIRSLLPAAQTQPSAASVTVFSTQSQPSTLSLSAVSAALELLNIELTTRDLHALHSYNILPPLFALSYTLGTNSYTLTDPTARRHQLCYGVVAQCAPWSVRWGAFCVVRSILYRLMLGVAAAQEAEEHVGHLAAAEEPDRAVWISSVARLRQCAMNAVFDELKRVWGMRAVAVAGYTPARSGQGELHACEQCAYNAPLAADHCALCGAVIDLNSSKSGGSGYSGSGAQPTIAWAQRESELHFADLSIAWFRASSELDAVPTSALRVRVYEPSVAELNLALNQWLWLVLRCVEDMSVVTARDLIVSEPKRVSFMLQLSGLDPALSTVHGANTSSEKQSTFVTPTIGVVMWQLLATRIARFVLPAISPASIPALFAPTQSSADLQPDSKAPNTSLAVVSSGASATSASRSAVKVVASVRDFLLYCLHQIGHESLQWWGNALLTPLALSSRRGEWVALYRALLRVTGNSEWPSVTQSVLLQSVAVVPRIMPQVLSWAEDKSKSNSSSNPTAASSGSNSSGVDPATVPVRLGAMYGSTFGALLVLGAFLEVVREGGSVRAVSFDGRPITGVLTCMKVTPLSVAVEAASNGQNVWGTFKKSARSSMSRASKIATPSGEDTCTLLLDDGSTQSFALLSTTLTPLDVLPKPEVDATAVTQLWPPISRFLMAHQSCPPALLSVPPLRLCYERMQRWVLSTLHTLTQSGFFCQTLRRMMRAAAAAAAAAGGADSLGSAQRDAALSILTPLTTATAEVTPLTVVTSRPSSTSWSSLMGSRSNNRESAGSVSSLTPATPKTAGSGQQLAVLAESDQTAAEDEADPNSVLSFPMLMPLLLSHTFGQAPLPPPASHTAAASDEQKVKSNEMSSVVRASHKADLPGLKLAPMPFAIFEVPRFWIYAGLASIAYGLCSLVLAF